MPTINLVVRRSPIIARISGAQGARGPTTWDGIEDKPEEFPPSNHSHDSSEISDSTAVGRAVITAATAALGRAAIGSGAAGDAAFQAATASALLDIIFPETNIEFTTLGSGWSKSGSVYTSDSSNSTGYSGINSDNLNLVDGGVYLLRFKVVTRTGGSIQVLYSAQTSIAGFAGYGGYDYVYLFAATAFSSNTRLYVRCSNGFIGSISNFRISRIR